MVIPDLPPVIAHACDRAARHLLADEVDAAIAAMTTPELMPWMQRHPRPGILLGTAYYQRGDARGDLFAACVFLERARALGCVDAPVALMLATVYFRLGRYGDCAALCATVPSSSCTPTILVMAAVAALLLGQLDRATAWAAQAAAQAPQQYEPQLMLAIVHARQQAPDADQCFARVLALTPPDAHAAIDHVRRAGADDEALRLALLNTAPGQFHLTPPGEEARVPYALPTALSASRGLVDGAKDFEWLRVNIPCQVACPAFTTVPDYINALAHEAYQEAYELNLQHNVFPGVLGRVCSRPCEDACRHGFDGNGAPVAICFLKRASDDWRSQRHAVPLSPCCPPTGKRVVIIGAGPAGLTLARDLTVYGHTCTVLDDYPQPGGMLVQGIPSFRLPRTLLTAEIAQILALGISYRPNTRVGRDVHTHELLQQYDAVVLALGTAQPNLLDLPGRDLAGIEHGLPFMERINRTNTATLGTQVVVIGGGFTAMDCSRSALRLGARSVGIYYRRTTQEMPVTQDEIVEARHEGVHLTELVAPVAYLGQNGRVTAVRFARTELGAPDASGRRRPIVIPTSTFDVVADTVLLATGQLPDYGCIADVTSPAMFAHGWLRVDPATHMTPVPQLFATGDFVSGAATIIAAIGRARRTALAVDTFLMGRQRRQSFISIATADATGRIREDDAIPRQTMPLCDPAQRAQMHAEVETGLRPTAAVTEARRCYLCHYQFEIDMRRCIYCDWCIKAKPAHLNCIQRVARFERDQQGIARAVTPAQSSDTTHAIWIDGAQCIRCGQCLRACPVDAIVLRKVSLTEGPCVHRAAAPFLPAAAP
jgi:formate dehydrogenase major subunit